MPQSIFVDSGNYSAKLEATALEPFQERLHALSKSELIQLRDMVVSCLSKYGHAVSKQPDSNSEASKLQQLTNREVDVLTLIASGYTRPEIAQVLTISRNTAATHVANIYRKLEIESIAEATLLAVRWGIVS